MLLQCSSVSILYAQMSWLGRFLGLKVRWRLASVVVPYPFSSLSPAAGSGGRAERLGGRAALVLPALGSGPAAGSFPAGTSPRHVPGCSCGGEGQDGLPQHSRASRAGEHGWGLPAAACALPVLSPSPLPRLCRCWQRSLLALLSGFSSLLPRWEGLLKSAVPAAAGDAEVR